MYCAISTVLVAYNINLTYKYTYDSYYDCHDPLRNATGKKKDDPLSYTTGIAIFVIVLLNAGIAAWTEHKAGDALEALSKMTQAAIYAPRSRLESGRNARKTSGNPRFSQGFPWFFMVFLAFGAPTLCSGRARRARGAGAHEQRGARGHRGAGHGRRGAGGHAAGGERGFEGLGDGSHRPHHRKEVLYLYSLGAISHIRLNIYSYFYI